MFYIFELTLAFCIFITILIDTIALLMKSIPENSDLGKVYASSQALGYITRLSLFIILPVIGLVLDKVIQFNYNIFFFFFSIFLSIHSLILYYKKDAIIEKTKEITIAYEVSIFDFFLKCFSCVFAKNEQVNSTIKFKLSLTTLVYGISHFFLAFIFPILLLMGSLFPESRAMLMGMTNVYTGIFSIYLTFFIERKIPYLENTQRITYIGNLVIMKQVFIFSASIALMILVFFLEV